MNTAIKTTKLKLYIVHWTFYHDDDPNKQIREDKMAKNNKWNSKPLTVGTYV